MIEVFYRAKNYQSFDLGLNPFLSDLAKIKEEIIRIEESIDLVMIMEYMDESMILLKVFNIQIYRLLTFQSVPHLKKTFMKLSPSDRSCSVWSTTMSFTQKLIQDCTRQKR